MARVLSAKVSKFIRKHIRRHVLQYGMPEKQAIAVAFQEAREKFPKHRRRLMLLGR